MNLVFKNKKIVGILTVLPSKEVRFEDEMGNYEFSIETSLKLKTVMGFDKRHIVDDDTCSSDLCIYGLTYLFDNNLLHKEAIDALILVTQTPDYILPPTSNVIQGRLELKDDMICMDINQGCSGYILGLIQAFLLLEQESIHQVVLMNVDVLSKKVSKNDRNSNPLIGDGASITIVEKSDLECTIYANIKMDGKRAFAIHIPAGGTRMPSCPETAVFDLDNSGNYRCKDNLIMKGDEVFMFVQKEVPPMITSLLDFAKQTKEEVDFFMFHQPNKFMLNKLADKLSIPREKMPCNIVENFGNSSGVSIPVTISYNLGKRLENELFNLCFAGFGAGLTWASMILEVGKLTFNRIIYLGVNNLKS